MKHVIFYSWQSDLDSALTRNFIEEALNRAVKSLNKDESVSVESVIDRDTSGVAGTPGIAETIFRKIDKCDVFVCDISIINGDTNETSDGGLLRQLVRAVARIALERSFRFRHATPPTPNPNVLAELGYAAARIGWERVILVQNTAFGDIGSLPFDLRSRRVVTFDLAVKESRPGERPKLRDQLERALKDALAGMVTPTFWPDAATPRWFGFWHSEQTATRSAHLFIREVGATGFLFHLTLIDGARSGSVSGFAKFTGPDTAYARIPTIDREDCEIKFRRMTGATRQIEVHESSGCRHFKGMGASFEGIYGCKRDLLFDSGALTELDLQRLYSITGMKFYGKLLDRFQQIGSGECSDKFPASVNIGGAKGLYTIFEAIVMKGDDGQLWAAFIDDNVVRYFTTEPSSKDRPPQTIETWRARFPEKTVIIEGNIEVIPKFY